MSISLNPTSDTMFTELAEVAVAQNAEAAIGKLPSNPDLRVREGDYFACGAVGHGLSSWFFRLALRRGRVTFDVTLPCWRALADDGDRERDARNITVVCKLALVVLGTEGFPLEGENFEVYGDERGNCRWRLVSDAGEELKSGEDWGGIADLVGGVDSPLEASDLFIIRP